MYCRLPGRGQRVPALRRRDAALSAVAAQAQGCKDGRRPRAGPHSRRGTVPAESRAGEVCMRVSFPSEIYLSFMGSVSGPFFWTFRIIHQV